MFRRSLADIFFDNAGWVLLAMLALCIFVCYKGSQNTQARYDSTMAAGYVAWIKETHNTNNLTFPEWKALVESTIPRQASTSYPIIVPIVTR